MGWWNLPRAVARETLDHLAADDPVAQRSRRDLARVHRAVATRSIVARGWKSLLPARLSETPLKILELGAGDGTLLLGVARSLAPAWPPVQLTLLDRLDVVDPATLAAFAELGWSVRVEVIDVLDWAALDPASAPRWDLITTAMFLHHFEGAQLDAILAAVVSRADRFFVCEPRRTWLTWTMSHFVGAIGGNAVTRQDAVLSVEAGFRDDELAALWPGAGAVWSSRNFGAGLFSQCLAAQRRELA